MKGVLPFALILTALILTIFSIVRDGGYDQLQTLKANHLRQQAKNQEKQDYVNSLRRDIYELKYDQRALEKKAREDVGMARPNEQVYFFDGEDDGLR
ncbi:MAG: septum formation initiator family protein [Deltaproteobacteria bacterium]|nr:septum formation initiator family protein [Deltaproteobacteria bacterium]